MIMSLIAAELLKAGYQNLKELDLEDVERIAKAIGFSRSGSLFPGLGVLGLGIVLGTGIGLLTATQPGRELRARLTRGFRSRIEQAKATRNGATRVEDLRSPGMAAD